MTQKKRPTRLTVEERDAIADEAHELWASGEAPRVAMRTALASYTPPPPPRSAKVGALVVFGIVMFIVGMFLVPALGWVVGNVLLPFWHTSFGWL